jgi:TPR repeat protein
LEKAAALGHARAMTLLGARELTGNAPKKSGLGGLARIRRAAAEGDPEGLLILSRAYSKGSEVGGVAKDPARGERLLQAAAAWGHPPAMRALGWHNRNQDPGQKKEAWVWFYLAAKYNTSLARRDYEVIKKEAIAEVLRLREVLSATELEAAQREATAREAMYRPLWTR